MKNNIPVSKKKIIAAHVLVKNEARFIWFSIMSVLPFVDRVRIWDMGSTDGTREIIEKIKNHPLAKDKIFYNSRVVNEFNESLQRQEMLDEEKNLFDWSRKSMLNITTADWFIVVDGDEIWWESSIKKLTDLIQKKGDELESIVVPFINPVGDIFHFQEEEAGRYKFGKHFGHYALRAINRKIPGLSSDKPHGQWGWTDGEGKMIQDRDPKKIGFINAPYLHVTHLQRGGDRSKDEEVQKRSWKLKHELGVSFPKDFFYPEVFFKERPDFIKSPWETMSRSFKIRAFFETPLRKLKRRLIYGKTGY